MMEVLEAVGPEVIALDAILTGLDRVARRRQRASRISVAGITH